MENKILLIGGLLVLICGCTPPDDTPETPKDDVDLFDGAPTPLEELKTPTESLPKKLTLPDTPSIDLSPKIQEPDYAAMKNTLMGKYRSEFKGPEPGMKIVIVLRDGSKKSGLLEKIEDDKVFIVLEAGTLGYARSSLHPLSQTKYFPEAFAQYRTLNDMKAAKAEYEKAVAEAERKKQMAAAARPTRSGKAVVKTVPKNDPSRRGEVWQVVKYLKEQSRDPENLRFMKWGKVQPKPGGKGGWQVSLQYAYSTPEQSNYVTHKWFLIDENGTVYRTALYKE